MEFTGPPPPTTFTLTIGLVENGMGSTTDPSPGSYVQESGASMIITAYPQAYEVFDHWELDGTDMGNDPSIIVPFNMNHDLVAIFIYGY